VDYGRPLEFGVNVDPSAAGLDQARELARRADAAGLGLIGIQDHPYQRRFLDSMMLIATLLSETQRIRLFPNVANLPLRDPAMLAKQAASLDVLSGGRFELGVGAGAFWDAIVAMGGPRRRPGESVGALEEAIEVIRLFFAGERVIEFSGRFYSVKGLHPGPPPAHPVEIWVGAYGPRMLDLVGRRADGWVPSLTYAPPETIPARSRRVDEAAAGAGRAPDAIRRIYNVMGLITDEANSSEGLRGSVSAWIERLTDFAIELGFDTFVFWPAEDPLGQLEQFATDVVPGVRETVARARSGD
jgi:alkanesulfonate monooxygenase SsuD/methylene tetrahydromethanopterin reductase-like flavin-dependent oxidoreductase (luciferase family)